MATDSRSLFGIDIVGERSAGSSPWPEQWDKHKFFDILAPAMRDPRVVEIGWRQYTPYFNDGDTCEFGAHDVWVRLELPEPEMTDQVRDALARIEILQKNKQDIELRWQRSNAWDHATRANERYPADLERWERTTGGGKHSLYYPKPTPMLVPDKPDDYLTMGDRWGLEAKIDEEIAELAQAHGIVVSKPDEEMDMWELEEGRPAGEGNPEFDALPANDPLREQVKALRELTSDHFYGVLLELFGDHAIVRCKFREDGTAYFDIEHYVHD